MGALDDAMENLGPFDDAMGTLNKAMGKLGRLKDLMGRTGGPFDEQIIDPSDGGIGAPDDLMGKLRALDHKFFSLPLHSFKLMGPKL